MKRSCPGIIRIFLFLIAGGIGFAAAAQQYYDVTKFGAKRDSSAKATLAIKKL